MKKILIITSSYYPKISATGICADKVADELKTKGYEIHIICPKKLGESNDEIIQNNHVHRVEMPLSLKIRCYGEMSNTLIRRIIYKASSAFLHIKLFLYLPLFPMISWLYIWRQYILAKGLYKENHYEGLIATYVSLEAIIVGALIKKKFSKVKFGIYMLDSLSNALQGRILPKKFVDKKGWQWEKRLYRYADKIYIMKCHERHHTQRKYEVFGNKIDILDFPLLAPPPMQKTYDIDSFTTKDKQCSIVYMGLLDKNYRNPQYACEVFSMLRQNDCTLSFYSRGNAEAIIEKYAAETNGKIKRQGFVDHCEAVIVMNEAQVLMSIGNASSEMVPSKIFECMAAGKPIIHFYSDDNDSSLSYYARYPLAITIKQDFSKVQNSADRVKKFIEENSNKSLQFEEVKKIFPLNTPEYTANRFDLMINS